MKPVVVKACSDKLSVEEVWLKLTDIENYPKTVTWVKSVKSEGRGLGARFEDVSTIMWVPINYKHQITSFDKNKEYAFSILLPLGAFAEERYILSNNNKRTYIEGRITCDLKYKMINKLLGPIVKNRQKKMLISTFRGMGGEIIE